MNRPKSILTIVFLICITHSVKAEILSSGGGDASSTNFQVTACIGETIIGLASSASSSTSCGFLVGINMQSPCSENPHPADSDKDCRIVISEVTAYGACWRTGCTWPVDPNPIPIGYVTICGYLWKVGECYGYNDLQVPPQSWEPDVCSESSILTMGDGAAGPVFSSFNPLCYTPESPVEVSIVITPDPGTMVYAVEDAPPTGWTVDSINESGSWDDVNKKVKWGPFFDANIRTLTYNVTPPAGETGEKTFSGTASFDGVDEPFERTITDCYCSVTIGDFDYDCDVDFDDLAILIENWLEGVF